MGGRSDFTARYKIRFVFYYRANFHEQFSPHKIFYPKCCTKAFAHRVSVNDVCLSYKFRGHSTISIQHVTDLAISKHLLLKGCDHHHSRFTQESQNVRTTVYIYLCGFLLASRPRAYASLPCALICARSRLLPVFVDTPRTGYWSLTQWWGCRERIGYGSRRRSATGHREPNQIMCARYVPPAISRRQGVVEAAVRSKRCCQL